MTRHYLSTGIVLFAFWLLLSGHFDPLLMGLGALASVLVVWLVARMDRVDGERVGAAPGLRIFTYMPWLLWAVARSSIDVARRIWHPALPIRPSWTRLPVRLATPLQRTLYANSITLTPGTLTTDVAEDHYLVHALSEESLAELESGEMESRIERLGI